jgi:hypothetical protein
LSQPTIQPPQPAHAQQPVQQQQQQQGGGILTDPARHIELNGRQFIRLNVLGKGGSSCVYRIIGADDASSSGLLALGPQNPAVMQKLALEKAMFDLENDISRWMTIANNVEDGLISSHKMELEYEKQILMRILEASSRTGF